jgi:hypothetical protein
MSKRQWNGVKKGDASTDIETLDTVEAILDLEPGTIGKEQERFYKLNILRD